MSLKISINNKIKKQTNKPFNAEGDMVTRQKKKMSAVSDEVAGYF